MWGVMKVRLWLVSLQSKGSNWVLCTCYSGEQQRLTRCVCALYTHMRLTWDSHESHMRVTWGSHETHMRLTWDSDEGDKFGSCELASHVGSSGLSAHQGECWDSGRCVCVPSLSEDVFGLKIAPGAISEIKLLQIFGRSTPPDPVCLLPWHFDHTAATTQIYVSACCIYGIAEIFCEGENFRNLDFHGENFLWIATKPRNSQKFSPSKVSRLYCISRTVRKGLNSYNSTATTQ